MFFMLAGLLMSTATAFEKKIKTHGLLVSFAIDASKSEDPISALTVLRAELLPLREIARQAGFFTGLTRQVEEQRDTEYHLMGLFARVEEGVTRAQQVGVSCGFAVRIRKKLAKGIETSLQNEFKMGSALGQEWQGPDRTGEVLELFRNLKEFFQIVSLDPGSCFNFRWDRLTPWMDSSGETQEA